MKPLHLFFLFTTFAFISCQKEESRICTISGNVFHNSVGLKAVTVKIFDNKKLLYDSKEKYFQYDTTDDSTGTYALQVALDDSLALNKFVVIYEKAGYTKAVCKVNIKKGVKSLSLDPVTLFRANHASKFNDELLYVYKDSSLHTEPQKIPTKDYLIWDYTVHAPFKDTIIKPDGKLYTAEGRWIEILYTINTLREEKGYFFYSFDKTYDESYKCFEAYVQPVAKCEVYNFPEPASKIVKVNCYLDSNMVPVSVKQTQPGNDTEGDFEWYLVESPNCEGWIKGRKTNVRPHASIDCKI